MKRESILLDKKMYRKGIAVLGSTGSIGTQTLEVIRIFPEFFSAEVLTAQNNVDLLIKQALEFLPTLVVIGDETKYSIVKEALAGKNIDVRAGAQALVEAVQHEEVHLVLTALVGAAGLDPTVAAIRAGKDIGLANKETLVVAGDLVMDLARRFEVNILPVDSEHSAIFQCLHGESSRSVEKIYLTASGGPFRGWDIEKLKQVTVKQALNHPNWVMGAKITIDSASLMNKGLEVIEAKWLFDLSVDQIDVLIHPQSIIHSMVQYDDGSILSQMGLPDMKLPIQYALGFPNRLENDFPRLDFRQFTQLTFEQPNREVFRNLDLAYASIGKGGNAPCVLNAANEVAVEAFLKERIGFLEMSEIIEKTLAQVEYLDAPDLDVLKASDSESRRIADEVVRQMIHSA